MQYEKMDFEVQISTFRKFWEICFGHVEVSKDIVWGPGGVQEPFWIIQDALEVIWKKKSFRHFLKMFSAFFKEFWNALEWF